MFEYDGEQYTLQDLQQGAVNQGLEFDDYFQQMKDLGMTEVLGQTPEIVPFDYKKASKTYGESWGDALGRTGLNLFSGATDFVDATKRQVLDLYFDYQDADQYTRDAIVKALEEQDGIVGLKGVGEQDIFELGIDYFGLDERIDADQSITEDIFGENTNYTRAGARIIESGLESIPSLAAAYLGAPGMIGYAAVLAGDKFQEEYAKDPDENTKRLYFNAVGSGGIEMGFEMVTRGLLKKAGFLGKGGDVKAAREILRGGAGSLVKNIGYGFTAEGASEAATELTQKLFDSLSREFGGLGKQMPSWDKIKYDLGDNFIVGGFIGGGISTFSEVGKRGEGAEQRATMILMEEQNKNKIFDLGEQITKLQRDHGKANDSGKKIIEQEVRSKAKEIQKIYDATKLGLNTLSSSDLKAYTRNIVNINSLKQDIKENPDNDSIKNINKEKIEKLVETNKTILGEAIAKGEEIQESQLQESIKFAEEKGEILGKKVKVVKDTESAKKEAELLGYKGDVGNKDGFILGDTIVINETVARESGAIAVGSHELLHGIIGNSFGKLDPKERAKLGKSFMNVLTSKQANAVRKRLKIYGIEGDAVFQSEEMFTAFSDAIIKKEISFNENVFSKIGNSIQEALRKLSQAGYIGEKSFLYRKEFSNGRQVYNFLKDYTKNVQKGEVSERAKKFAKEDVDATVFKESITKEEKAQIEETVKEIGATYSFKGGKKLWDQGGANQAIDEIKREGYLDNLIAAKYKVRPVPEKFVSDVITELTQHIKNFNPEVNDNLFGWIQGQLGNKATKVYNEIYKKKEQEKTARDIDDRTKEGEVRVQVAAEEDVRMKAFEEEDISPAARAKRKVKTEQDKRSKFRQQLGVETEGKLYNQVLETARVVLKRAYEAGTSVRNIQRKLTSEANKYKNPDGENLFVSIKNFLGTKDKYFKNLARFRKPIMDVMFTADLVQMEREVVDDKKVFTKFVKKLTTIKEVENAVDQMKLPPSAIDVYKRDKSVNLYEKLMPSEEQFIAYFNQPLNIPNPKDPKTTIRSGLRGTRKDQLVKRMVSGLVFDATMQVAQEPDIINAREIMAEMQGETLADKDLQNLAEAIGREVDIKFSETINTPKFSKMTTKQGKRKYLPVLDKIIEKEQEGFVKSILIELREDVDLGLNFKEARIGNIPLSNIIDTDAIIQDVKDTKAKDIREIGHNTFVKLLKGADIDQVLNFAKNVFRSTRSAGVFNITTNELLIKEVLDVISNGKFKGQFKLKETSKGSGKFRLIHNGKKVELYEDVTNIKKNSRKNTELVDTVNKQAKEAQKFIIDFIKNTNLTKGQKIAGLQLIAYDQRGALRKASKMGITLNKDVEALVSELTLEHEITIDHMLDVIIDAINNPNNISKVETMFENAYVHVLPNSINTVLGKIKINGISYKTKGGEKRYFHPKVLEYLKKLEAEQIITIPPRLKFSQSQDFKTINNAIKFSRSTNNPTKGISVLDFDDTLATTKSLVKYTAPDGKTGSLNAEQYASTYQDLLEKGYEFDFTEFNKVVKGRVAPLFQKALKLQSKFGPKNMFVLTARPPAAANAIHVFLKANGLNIPLKNITGLADSTAEAKALWVANKVGEGFNDFY